MSSAQYDEVSTSNFLFNNTSTTIMYIMLQTEGSLIKDILDTGRELLSLWV